MTLTSRIPGRIRRAALTLEACEARVLMATGPSLGVAAGFAVLGGTTVTNTGATNIVGDIGVSPGTSITGFPPGVVTGTLHAGDPVATQAEADLATAYGVLAGEAVDTTLSGQDLGGLTLTPGVYNFSAAATLNGTLTLDAQGDPNAVFVIRSGTTLTTGTGSAVVLSGGAHARNVFWQVGSSATIGTNTAFKGNILAFTSISMNTGADISQGRALAINGAVTLDTNTTSNVFTTPLTITANDQVKTYGAALPILTASYSGFINGETAAGLQTQPTLTSTATAASHVAGNPYTITAAGAADPYYTFTYVAGSLTVTPAPLTITANDQSKPYGSALPTLTASYAGFVNGDTSASLENSPTLATTATAASHVAGNPYAITVGGTFDPDYAISYVAGSLIVTPAPLTITADDQVKQYGAAVPTLTASYTGFVNGDTSASLESSPTLATAATAASHVAGSPYAIILGGAADSDYAITYAAGSLIVTPATLTITADDQAKVYGDAIPLLTASYSGFVNGDNSASLDVRPTLATIATAGSHVAGSPYAITAAGAADPDYTISYVAGSLTVTPAPLTITANDQSKPYGSALPTLTASYTGLVNGDTAADLQSQPRLATTATAGSHVAGNPYAITVGGTFDPDYSISYVAGSLTVTPVVLTITADDQSKVYGDALPTLTASYTGFVNGDTAADLQSQPRLATTATAGSHVAGSPYAITAAGAADPDYTFSYMAGSLIVTPATLTIAADDQVKQYGAAVPTLTASYTGLVNGDTAADLSAQPTLSTAATAGSHVAGSPYAINVAGATDPDYAITYAAGSLTVTPAPLTITADDQSKAFGAAVPTLTASYSGLVNGDTSATFAEGSNAAPTLTTTATASSTVAGNPYAINAAGAVDPNYAITYVAGSLTVAPPSAISGRVYLDVNASGSPDAGEPGLADRVVFLDSNHNGILDAGEATATTVADGNYTLSDALGGSGTVLEATDQDANRRYVVGQARTIADGTVTVGVVPISSIAPVNVIPSPFSSNPSGDPHTAYVQSLYRAVLGRTGGDSEVASWLVRLNVGMTQDAVAREFVNSIEHRQDQVESYYENFLGRTPDPSSAFWVNSLRSGVSEQKIAEAFLISPEYQASHQDSTLLVHDLYLDVLGRRGEAAGVAAWESALAGGASRESIIDGFVESVEADNQLVTSFYASFLRRAREQGTTSNPWVTILMNPDGSPADVATGILTSAEYKLRATTPG